MSDLMERRHSWVERVLGIGLHARAAASEERARSTAQLEQELKREDTGDAGAAYGKGYAPFDTRDVHEKLKQALASGTMISSADWTDAAQPLTKDQRQQLLGSREAMKQRLKDLGEARSEQRRLSGELETAERQLAPIDSSIGLMHGVRSGPPLCAKGSVGIPSSEYDAQIAAAGKKWYAMLDAGRKLQEIVPDINKKAAHTEALDLLGQWKDYWWDTQADLERAKAGGTVGFDPGLRATPKALPDLTGFSSEEFDKAKDWMRTTDAETPPAAPPPTVPAPKILKADFATEIAAAEEKWDAMLKAQWQFEAIKTPTDEQTAALDLIKQWGGYWFGIKFRLEDAQNNGADEFDPGTMTPPATRPDLGALKATAKPGIKKARADRDNHKTNVLEPIERDMQQILPLLDAPENNPERIEVGGALEMLEEINSKITENGGMPTKKMLAEKTRALAYLERTLLGWNDRRTRQNLPPAGEAVALADMLQVEHRKMIDHVVANKLPLPIADIDAMDPEEEQALQASWSKLCDGSGTIKIPLDYDSTSTKPGASKTEQEAQQFRSETLANFARLLASSSGRRLVHELEASDKEIRFEASDSAACLATGGGKGLSRPKLITGDEATTEEEARKHKGSGTGSTVFMVRGAKDSDVALCTEAGGQLHSPRFIAMGHEMVHALHNVRGIDRDMVTLTEDPAWNNSEELQTIRKGKLSEQTLRAQYGMSAERFGHKRTEPGQQVADAFAGALDVLANDSKLEARGFKDFDLLAKATRIAISEASPELKGPLPAGWDANQLNVAQMRVILEESLRADLKKLGWSPFDLAPPGDGDRIDDVLKMQHYHPRSPQGLRFRSLGGEESLDAIEQFKKNTNISISDWQETSWPSKLAALEAAESWVTAFCLGKEGAIGKLAADKGKLTTRLARLTDLVKEVDLDNEDTATEATAFAKAGGMQAMARIHQLNMVLKTALPEAKNDVTAMLDAMDKTRVWLAAFAKAIDKIESKEADVLIPVMSSSIGGGGALASILEDVVMCCRRGRAEVDNYLASAVTEANEAL
jgi:hypothetical protein